MTKKSSGGAPEVRQGGGGARRGLCEEEASVRGIFCTSSREIGVRRRNVLLGVLVCPRKEE